MKSWVDESKEADIENLGDCLRALGDGMQLGDFSPTIVLYGRSKLGLEQLVGEFAGVFTNGDGNLFVETYNQLNAVHDPHHQADQSRRIGMPCKLAEKGIVSAPA